MAANNPLNTKPEPVSWNFNLLSQNDLGGFGGMGEGIAIQLAKDGRRIAWLAHESAPKNFTGVDVTDPRNPKVIVQTELPNMFMRSNSLDLSGDILAVAYQTQKSRHASRPGWSCSTCRCRRSHARCRSSTARARIRAACISCGSATANTSTWPPARRTSSRAIRTTTSSTAASTCAIHRSRSKSAAGGCRAPRCTTTSRRRRAIRSTRAIARTTPMSIRSGRTACTSATSTAACS